MVNHKIVMEEFSVVRPMCVYGGKKGKKKHVAKRESEWESE